MPSIPMYAHLGYGLLGSWPMSPPGGYGSGLGLSIGLRALVYREVGSWSPRDHPYTTSPRAHQAQALPTAYSPIFLGKCVLVNRTIWRVHMETLSGDLRIWVDLP